MMIGPVQAFDLRRPSHIRSRSQQFREVLLLYRYVDALSRVPGALRSRGVPIGADTMSILFAALASIALVAAHASRLATPSQETCAAITNPAPCGQPNDGPELCGWKGCCWDPSKGSNACFYPGGNAVPITHVHIVQACHFDAGYANTTTNIMNLWFHTHFPQAVRESRGGGCTAVPTPTFVARRSIASATS